MSTAIIIMLVSGIIGLLLGFLAQRSRMCFIGGWRDFFIIRDTYLLKGFFSFVITASILFFLVHSVGWYLQDYPWYKTVYNATVTGQTKPDTESDESKIVYGDVDPCNLTYEQSMAIFMQGSQDNTSSEDEENEPAATPTLPERLLNIFSNAKLMLGLLAAFLIGLFSTLANGCPLRQHVMAGSGNSTSIMYLLGFYIAVIAFNYIGPLLP